MAAPKKEIAFIDPGISNLETFIAGLRPEVEAVVLSDHEPAPRQMARALEGREGIEAIHVVAHGWPGEVSFGSGALSLDTMDEYAAELAEVGRMLRGGEFHLWSCETALGKRGAAFVDALARATGVDVAGSTGLVGAAAQGGRWGLDVGSSEMDARAPLTADGVAAYAGLMATKTWSGTTTGNWSTAGNWSPSAPVAGDDIVIGNSSQSSSFTVTLDQPGTYTYHCSIHPFMTGTVVVQ